MTHKSHEYLIICDAFRKYPFVFKVRSKSATSLCTRLLELISQYGPPMSLSTDNGPPFASDELREFLMHHCIAHHMSSPHFSRSNGFIERQVRTIKTALNTDQPANKPLAAILLDLRSMPIGQRCHHHVRSSITDPSSDQADLLNPSTWSKSGTS